MAAVRWPVSRYILTVGKDGPIQIARIQQAMSDRPQYIGTVVVPAFLPLSDEIGHILGHTGSRVPTDANRRSLEFIRPVRHLLAFPPALTLDWIVPARIKRI